ncbi:uncharacterized protein [Patagioenas fasciata]|uniref:uncharacterized protein isoform X3 n=1 Tax=Patagioenas fasciata TaxID=372321 RepID=UPI003A9A27FF
MSSSQRCWSLGSLLLLLLGGNLGVLIEIHQDPVNGTVGQSVLLPVSYRFAGAPHFPVSISWTFNSSLDKLVTCTVRNCSLGAGGAPSNCSANCFPKPTNNSRAELFPENGSLLLRDLRLSDSGVYSVTFGQSSQIKKVFLTLREQRVTPQHPSEGAAEKQKRRVIKQHQVSSVEESHMDSTAEGDMTTIYARIGDTFEQPQPTPTAQSLYASVTSPRPPGLDTRPFHHPV